MKNRIIVDLDDTLSFTLNRDFDNAEPNRPLIQKLNSLAEKGWEIDIVTARGQLSCVGDSEKADKKYRERIITWLEKNDANFFSTISFQKKLARYYIDDKALTPEQFLELDFENNGKSGCHIVMDSQYVYKEFKTFEEAQALIDWSNLAQAFLSDIKLPLEGEVIIPKIHTLIGNEIKMDRLRDRTHTLESLKQIIQIANHFKEYAPSFDQSPMIYLENIFNHLNQIGWSAYQMEFTSLVNKKLMSDSSLLKLMNFLNQRKSFSHGDFSIQNVLLVGAYSIGLIDPIHHQSKFQSYMIDLAKLRWSLILENNPVWIDFFEKEIGMILDSTFNNLTICEGIRTLKYCTPSEKLRRMEVIEELCSRD